MERAGTEKNRVLSQPDKFLDVSECAKLLKMSTRYVYDLLRQGKGPPARRFGKRYRIRYSSLMNWASRSPDTKGQ